MAVLVAPEERHRRVRRRLGRRAPSPTGCGRRAAPCSAALVQCSTRISSPNSAVRPPGARRQRRTRPARRPQRLVADDAVAQRQPAAVQPLGRRRHADADHDHVGRHQLAVVQPSHRRRPSSSTRTPQRMSIAVGGVHRRGGEAHLGAEAADQRSREALEHGHRAAPGSRRGCDLEADEPGADDGDARRAVGDPLRAAPSESSSVRSSWTVGTSSWPGRRRVAEPVAMITPSSYGTVDPSASSTARASVSSPDAGTPRRTSSADGRVLVRLAQGDAVGLPVAGEQLLRQRRTVVGQVRLGADQRDRAGVAVGAQRLARPEPGDRGPDHHDPGITRTWHGRDDAIRSPHV